MNTNEVLKLALEALFTYEDDWVEDGMGGVHHNVLYDKNKVFKAITALREALAEQPAQQQEPVAQYIGECSEGSLVQLYDDMKKGEKLYTSPPAQRKPLTHRQRVDLLAKFEAHKHEWHAPAILIDMVEAAHGIKENT